MAKSKILRCNIRILYILLLGNIQIRKSKQQKKLKTKWLIYFDNRTTKSTNFKTTVLPNDSTIKEINEAAQAKNTKVETLPESSTGVWISVLLQVILPLGVLGFLLYTMFMSQGGQGGRNNPMNFGKSRATNQKKQKRESTLL